MVSKSEQNFSDSSEQTKGPRELIKARIEDAERALKDLKEAAEATDFADGGQTMALGKQAGDFADAAKFLSDNIGSMELVIFVEKLKSWPNIVALLKRIEAPKHAYKEISAAAERVSKTQHEDNFNVEAFKSDVSTFLWSVRRAVEEALESGRAFSAKDFTDAFGGGDNMQDFLRSIPKENNEDVGYQYVSYKNQPDFKILFPGIIFLTNRNGGREEIWPLIINSHKKHF